MGEFQCEEETHSTPVRNRTVFVFWLRKLLVVYLHYALKEVGI